MKKASETEAAVIILGNNGTNLGIRNTYIQSNPNNLFIFEAEIYTDKGKIWTGDIDVTVSINKLKKLSKYLGKKLFVLREKDKGDLNLAIIVINGDNIELMNAFNLYYKIENGRPIAVGIDSYLDMTKKEYSLNDIKKTFRLPIVSRLKVRDGFTVLEAFYTAVCGVLEEGEYENLIVSSTYAISLMERVKKYYHKMFPNADEQEIEEMCAWEWHDLGPKNFFKDPEWVDSKMGYVLK
jgi:hypothetical protein